MANSWVLVANASRAKIYAIDTKNSDIKLITSFDHPEARLKEHDLVTDRPGQFNGQNPARGAYVGSSAKEAEAERFSKKITEDLRRYLNKHLYERLIIIASPEFLGHIKMNMDNNLKEATRLYIPKDFTCITTIELLTILLEEYRSAFSTISETT